MKKYLLFCGYVYYPSPAWDDFVGTFDTIEECRAKLAQQSGYDWHQIVNTETLAMEEYEVKP